MGGEGQEFCIVLLIGVATAILPPRTFVGIAKQIRSSDVVMRAQFGTAQAGKIGFGPVGRDIAVCILHAVVYRPQNVSGRDPPEMRCLIGKHFASRLDDLVNDSSSIVFGTDQRPTAPAPFAKNDHALPLTCPVRNAPAILPQRPMVARLNISAKICSIDLHFAAKGSKVLRGRDGFTKLMLPNERGLIGNLKLLAHTDSTETLGGIHEVGDKEKQVSIRKLAACEDSA